jgi:diguanylate cyclase (GGDEF)-like protein/PAS domain S-box-containing protein
LEIDNQLFKIVLDSLKDGVYFADLDRKITYWNKGAEDLTGYRAEEIVGKHCADNILVHVDMEGNNLCESGCPMSKSIQEGDDVDAEVYLRHKDGYRLFVSIKTVPIRDPAGKIIGAAEVFRDQTHQEVLMGRMKQLEDMALIDPLTNLANRRHTEAWLQTKVKEFNRYGRRFGVLFIDVDKFKQINDNNSHEVGDKVLKFVSLTLLNSLRPFDFIGRWGGDEFVAIAVNIDEKQLLRIAERARRLVEISSFDINSRLVNATVSIGATLAHHGDSMESLLNRTDKLMYESKSQGGNRVSS